jgi:hypothetical protein
MLEEWRALPPAQIKGKRAGAFLIMACHLATPEIMESKRVHDELTPNLLGYVWDKTILDADAITATLLSRKLIENDQGLLPYHLMPMFYYGTDKSIIRAVLDTTGSAVSYLNQYGNALIDAGFKADDLMALLTLEERGEMNFLLSC